MIPSAFYLTSSDSDLFSEIRLCTPLRQLKTSTGIDAVIVRISPPELGQPFGLGGEDLHEVVLTARWKERPLTNIASMAVPVHVYRLLETLEPGATFISADDLKSLAWCEVYSTPEAAELKQL